jgi:hypothetical protein
MKLASLLVLAACGDNLAPAGRFDVVGHADLGARGLNSALAVAGDTVYVGTRNDAHGVAIVDISDPTQPTMVGELGGPIPGISSRELRAVPDLNLLVVLYIQCTSLHGCSAPAAQPEQLELYDITDRRAPKLAATYAFQSSGFARRDPHEFFLWRDGPRVLLYVSTPGAAPQLEIVDASNAYAPAKVVQWDAVRDGGLDGSGGGNNILHSIGASDDGRVGYVSHQLGGLVLIDLGHVIDGDSPPAIAMITPPAQALHWTPLGMGPHSAVRAPGRDLLVVTEEIYPSGLSTGCPWGYVRMVDISDPTTPTIAGVYKVPENDPSYCPNAAPLTAFTSHNPTVLHDLALVTWYAGGLQAIEISDPAHPYRLAELRPDPLPAVEHEDPLLGGNPVEMWSYPVIQNGLIYVVDVRNGLYVLRYSGYRAEQVDDTPFHEGNSNRGQ